MINEQDKRYTYWAYSGVLGLKNKASHNYAKTLIEALNKTPAGWRGEWQFHEGTDVGTHIDYTKVLGSNYGLNRTLAGLLKSITWENND